MSTIIERKVRGWLSGVIDDMRRSSPVQQWLDSLPADETVAPEDTSEEVKISEPKSDDNDNDSKADETVTENTVIEPNKEELQDDQNLEVPLKEAWKRKSLDSGLLTSTPQQTNVKRLQRDHSIQSEGYSPKFKNPLFRDHSLQVYINFIVFLVHNLL